jgi:hypothetical protein
VRGVTDDSASLPASPWAIRSVSAKGGATKHEPRPESQVAIGGAWRAPESGIKGESPGVASNERFSGIWRLPNEVGAVISLRSSLSSDPGEAGGSSQASGVEPGEAAYKVDRGHEVPGACEGQRRTDSPFSPLVMGIEDNGGSATSAVEDGDDGKLGVVFSVSSAHISIGSSRGCCTPLYTPISLTAFSLSALEHTSYRELRNSRREDRLLTCLE